jgi:hypothetical protein
MPLAPALDALLHGVLEGVVSASLDEVAQGRLLRRVAVKERVDGHRILQHAGRFKLAARVDGAHGLRPLVHVHPALAHQPHHPHEARTRGEKLVNLLVQVLEVLPLCGVLHDQRRHRRAPPGLLGADAHGHVGRAQRAVGQRDARVDAYGGRGRVGVEHVPPAEVAARAVAPCRQALDRMPVGELVRVAVANLVDVKRARCAQRVRHARNASTAPG